MCAGKNRSPIRELPAFSRMVAVQLDLWGGEADLPPQGLRLAAGSPAPRQQAPRLGGGLLTTGGLGKAGPNKGGRTARQLHCWLAVTPPETERAAASTSGWSPSPGLPSTPAVATAAEREQQEFQHRCLFLYTTPLQADIVEEPLSPASPSHDTGSPARAAGEPTTQTESKKRASLS